MRYLSLCSGIEAASVAWEPLGWQRLSHRILPPALHRQQLRVALRRELEAEARAVREYTRCSLGATSLSFLACLGRRTTAGRTGR